MADFERIVQILPAWDRRDPDPNKNYGIHCCELRMVLKGELGAVQFLLYTGWYLPENRNSGLDKPVPADLGYHSPIPMYEDQYEFGECEYLDGRKCYYDGSGLQAEEAFEVLVAEGDEGLWKYLARYYEDVFKVATREAT